MTNEIVGCAQGKSAPEILATMRDLYQSGAVGWVQGAYITWSESGNDGESSSFDDIPAGSVVCGACLEGLLGLVTCIDTSVCNYTSIESVPDEVKEAERALTTVAGMVTESTSTPGNGLVEACNDEDLSSLSEVVDFLDKSVKLLTE